MVQSRFYPGDSFCIRESHGLSGTVDMYVNIVKYCDDHVNLEQELTRSVVNHSKIKQRIEVSGVNVSEFHKSQS